MTTKYYRNANGDYLGAFDVPPEGGIEVSDAPDHADQKWGGEEGWRPLPDPIPDEISRRQFCQGLAVAGLIAKQEAIAFIQGSALPSAIQAIVDGMTDEEAAFEATMLLLGAGSFFRSHPLVLIFAMAQSMTETEVDNFWRLCASL
ncbi:hypothetical protein [Shinella zoogloeoides]|uniref:hypothetical protein n=1 Tax=Shinella zoogloeoides TaxID=352475 RepID=UPI0028B00E04|nr:hypothetical protein [Shinella zoogloeoides]